LKKKFSPVTLSLKPSETARPSGMTIQVDSENTFKCILAKIIQLKAPTSKVTCYKNPEWFQLPLVKGLIMRFMH
jgi:hypothetical protein